MYVKPNNDSQRQLQTRTTTHNLFIKKNESEENERNNKKKDDETQLPQYDWNDHRLSVRKCI